MKRGPPSFKAEYDYAWCLVRSPSKTDMLHGIAMLEGMNTVSSVMCPFVQESCIGGFFRWKPSMPIWWLGFSLFVVRTAVPC